MRFSQYCGPIEICGASGDHPMEVASGSGADLLETSAGNHFEFECNDGSMYIVSHKINVVRTPPLFPRTLCVTRIRSEGSLLVLDLMDESSQ